MPRTRALIATAVFLTLAKLAPADPILFDSTWKGNGPPAPAGDNVNWSDPNNWTPNIVPKNLPGTVEFNVTIPAGASVTYDAQKSIPGPSTLGQSTLDNVTLSNDATLVLTTSGATPPALTINGAATLAGILDIRAGSFNATSPGVTFADDPTTPTNRARVYASGGAAVEVSAQSYSSLGLAASDGLYYPHTTTFNWNLFTANGAGTKLILPSLATIDASYAARGDDINRQHITATSSGLIDLSSVQSVNAPISGSDWLEFKVSDTAEIRLASLQSVSGAGRGQIRFVATAGAALHLPNLTSITNAVFDASTGARISVDRSAGADYSSKVLTAEDGLYYAHTSYFDWNLATATGAGSLLDLSAIRHIDAGYAGRGDDVNRQHITASGGAIIDLSNVQAVTAPASGSDWLEFNVADTAQIRLVALSSITGAGGGEIRFVAGSGAVLDLPGLTNITNAVFDASAGAQIRIQGLNGATYSSTAYTADDGLYYPHTSTFDWNLFTATGTGTRLDLPAVKSLDAGFSGRGDDVNRHHITASAGAVVDLSGLNSITIPASSNDSLEFNSTGPSSSINLSSLTHLHSPGNGQLLLNADTGASLTLGRLSYPRTVHVTLGGDNTHLNVLSSLWAGPTTTVSQGAGVAVAVGRDFKVADAATYTAGARSTLSVGRDFLFSSTDESKFNVKPAALTFTGDASAGILEAGGLDVATATFILSNSNFALGTLAVGTPGHPSTLHLMDIANNGNRGPSAPEALYLNYDGADVNGDSTPGDEGLTLAPGSTLVLNGIKLYAWHAGSLTSINSLFTGGVTQIPWGAGTIRLSLPATAGDVDFSGSLTAHDIDLLYAAVAGQSRHPFFDLNADGSPTNADVDLLVHTLLSTNYGDADLNHSVNINDVLTLVDHYGDAGDVSWSDGDFTGDSLVDFHDLNAMAYSFLAGDTAPFDGVVDLSDLNNVLNNFGSDGLAGDTPSFDGHIDLSDVNAVLNNFGARAAPASLLVVPEPATALTYLFAILLLPSRRIRTAQVARRTSECSKRTGFGYAE